MSWWSWWWWYRVAGWAVSNSSCRKQVDSGSEQHRQGKGTEAWRCLGRDEAGAVSYHSREDGSSKGSKGTKGTKG